MTSAGTVDWSWAHRSEETVPPTVDPSQALAVLVVHNAAPWLPRTLAALEHLDPRPRIVAVDNGSEDGSPAMLERACSDGLLAEVLHHPATASPGEAVRAAERGCDESVRWIWILHDDAEPRPDALAWLLRSATAERDDGRHPALVVPTLLQPRRRNHPDRLSEAGQSVSATGARVLGVEPGDLDQRQLSSRTVLGASTAGLLVDRRAWQELDGASPQLPLFRDGVDLGWRAHLAGWSVLTCPQAALYHRRAGHEGQRRSALAPNPERTDRLLGMRLVAARSRHPLLAELRLALAGLLVALGHLLGKAPARSSAMAGAVLDLLRTREQTRALAGRPAGGHALPPGLRPGRGQMARRRLDQFAGWVVDRVLPAPLEDTSLDELTADEVVPTRRRSLLVPVLAASLALASLVANRRLFGLGTLAGPALAPAPDGLGAAWDAWLRLPAGQVAQAPWLGLGALGSTLVFGRPGWFAVLAQLVAVPLAVLASWGLWRRLAPRMDTWGVAALALAWGLAQPLLGVSGSGSPGTLLVCVVLPLACRAWLDWTTAPRGGAEALRAPARFALWAGLACWGLPVLYVAAVGAVAWALSRRPDPRGGTVALLGPVLLCLPWLARLAAQPSRLLTTTDPLWASRGEHAHLAWGNTPWWLVAPCLAAVWVLAAWGLWRRGGAGAGIAALGALLAWGCGLLAARAVLPLDGQPVRPDGTGWLLLAVLLLLGLATAVPERRLVAGLLVPVLAGGLWWLVAAAAPVHRTRSALPAHVAAVQHSQRATRALALDLTAHPARWSVTAADQPRWGTAEQAVVPDPAAHEAAEALVRQLVAGQSSDQLAQQARSLGIAHLWVRGADPELVAAISDSPGLGPAGTVGEDTTWTVTGLVSRDPASEWTRQRQWWPAVATALASGLLLVLAAPSTVRDDGPRRAAADPHGRTR